MSYVSEKQHLFFEVSSIIDESIYKEGVYVTDMPSMV